MSQTATSKTDKIVDQGGPVMANAKVQLIFWGNWNDSSLDPSKDRIATAIQHIINSEYYSKLSQYRGIQKPTYLGSVVNSTLRLSNKFEDDDVEQAIRDSINNGSVPDFRSFTNGQIMYLVIPTPLHTYTEDSEDDGDAWHSNFRYKGNDKGVYSVYSWHKNRNKELEGITRAFAHEIAEACTNPGPGDAFIDPEEADAHPKGDYEIADFCEKEASNVNGEKVEGYWSNLDGGCVIPGK